MMKKFRKVYQATKSKLSIRWILFFVLFILTVSTVWQVNSFFSFKEIIEQTTVSNISKENSLKELAAFLNLNNEDNIFTDGLLQINNALFVNTKNKTLIFQPKTNEKQIIIEYESVNSLIKKVKKESEKIFDDFINDKFQIQNYSQLVDKKDNLTHDEIVLIGSTIGADKDYLEEVAKKVGVDIRAILLSLIYNTVYSGNSGHIATVIKDQKLYPVSNMNYKTDIVNLQLLSVSLTILKSDAKNDRKKFIESEYSKYLPTDSTIEPNASYNELQAKIEKLLKSKSIRFDASVPFDFLFINFRKDILYCGDKAYPYNPNNLNAKDESSLGVLFGKQFGIKNYQSLSAKQLVSQIGISVDTVKFSEKNNNLQTTFTAILDYLLNNPSVYCINNGKLESPFIIKNDSILYGKFDKVLLQDAFDKLKEDDLKDSKYVIVKKENFTPIFIYITLILIFLTYFTMFFLNTIKRAPIDEETIIQPVGIDDQLKNQKEKYEEQLVNTKKEVKEKTIVELTKYLTNPGEYENYGTSTLKEVRHKVVFYNEIEKSKNSVNLVKLLNVERANNINIPIIESSNDIFEKANKASSKTDKITYMLEKFDEYLTHVSKDKEKLSEVFLDFKKAKHSIDDLNTLLIEDYKSDFFNRLKENIIKIETNPTIENFVRFGLLFKSSNQRKFKHESEILKVYNQTNIFIDDFYGKYKKISDNKLLERTALICWTLDLAYNLIQIKDATFSIDLEKVKQDQLQLLSIRYFIHNAINKNKTVDDFNFSIMESNKRIANYNNSIADSISELKKDKEYSEYLNVLKDLMRKIKMYESSELVFKKLHDHFVADFFNKIEKLRYDQTNLFPEDRSWLFQQLFNITFHAADYVDYYIKEDDVKYHSNYLFLKNNLDLSVTDHRQFDEMDIEKSTRASLAIFKAAKFVGVKKLDILINKYYIKPEQLK